MNWFERYGIIGIYYIALSSILLKCLSSISIPDENIEIIIAIGAGLSLPIGYILSILSQNIYYILPKWFQIHKKACEEINSLSNLKEIHLESKLAIITRLDCPDSTPTLEQYKWLQDYTRKRWDVLAISSSMFWATIIAWVHVLLTIYFMRSIDLDLCKNNEPLFPMLVILSVIILIILFISRYFMSIQIVDVFKVTFKELVEKSENLRNEVNIPNNENDNEHTPRCP